MAEYATVASVGHQGQHGVGQGGLARRRRRLDHRPEGAVRQARRQGQPGGERTGLLAHHAEVANAAATWSMRSGAVSNERASSRSAAPMAGTSSAACGVATRPPVRPRRRAAPGPVRPSIVSRSHAARWLPPRCSPPAAWPSRGRRCRRGTARPPPPSRSPAGCPERRPSGCGAPATAWSRLDHQLVVSNRCHGRGQWSSSGQPEDRQLERQQLRKKVVGRCHPGPSARCQQCHPASTRPRTSPHGPTSPARSNVTFGPALRHPGRRSSLATGGLPRPHPLGGPHAAGRGRRPVSSAATATSLTSAP